MEEQALELAQSHRDAEPAVGRIFLFPNDQEVRLLEEVTDAPDSGEIFPISFSPRPGDGLPHRMVFFTVSPSELEQIQNGVLVLPEGWDLGNARAI